MLGDFGTNPVTGSTQPPGTYAVAVTSGSATDPILASPYRPAAGYNGTNDFAVDTRAYRVEFAAGDFDTDTPTKAPQPTTSINGTSCGDAAPATGWQTSPTAPAITAYAASKGLSDPLDVVNRVRVTFTDAVEPGTFVGVKLRFAVRNVFRDATSQSGDRIPATTPLFGSATLAYDQLATAPWTVNAVVGPVVPGSLGVRTSVAVAASPGSVQAGSTGLDTSTYTVRPTIAVGEDITSPQIVRVFDYLPASMKYVTGSASVDPDQVLRQADGTTLLVWDFGLIDTPASSSTALPPFTFRARADPIAPAPSINYDGVVVEAVDADGVQQDARPIVASNCASPFTLPVPATPSVPVDTTTQMIPPANRGGCSGQGWLYRYAYASVSIGNAFVTLAASSTADQLEIQPGDADGVGGAGVGWSLDYANYSSQTLAGVDLVDVLPFAGDGRTPPSAYSGSLALTRFATDDALSATPNALPDNGTGPFPTRAGTTFYFTVATPASVSEDAYDATNLRGGTTRWCLQADFGTAGCPTTLADATGVRVISGALAAQQKHTVRLGFATAGNTAGDVYSNEAAARAIGVTSLTPIQGDAITVVASSIAGTVWDDANGDGVVGAGETVRIAGASVRLTGTDDLGAAVTETTTTAADGTYAFADLRPGTYTATIDQASVRAVKAGYALTFDADSGTTTPDGSVAILLTADTAVTARDFGFATQSLAGTVYRDADNNGAEDAGETGVAGATVTATGTDDLGAPVSITTTTTASGDYAFDEIRPGTYTVALTPVAGSPTGASTAGSAGGTPGAYGSGTISGVVVDAANDAIGYRFGVLAPQVVSGVVFVDTDGDGVRDASEPALPNVAFALTGTDSAGAVSRTERSDAQGRIEFSDLRNGSYTLTETQPGAYLDGRVSVGASVGTAGINRVTGIAVDGANTTSTYSFAELRAASLAGTVFDDLDADGSLDTGEPGVESATVTLTGTDDLGDPVSRTFVTASGGTWSFTQLRPGTYTLTQALAAGYLDGRETAGTAGGTVDDTAAVSRTIGAVAIAPGIDATGYLFGEVRPATLSGAVFVDSDADGAQGADEAGIPGVALTITGTDDFGALVRQHATTDAAGAWSATPLRPGTYTVAERQPAGYLQGATTVGTAGGTASGDTVSSILLGSGTAGSGYLFAERTDSSLEGTVFADSNADGVQGPGENGLSGVTITLVDASGADLRTTTTDADGGWLFTGLVPGTYGVRETQPDGFFDGTAVLGTGGGTIGANRVTGIAVDGVVDGYAFTEYPPSVLRGTVWHDSDDDGVIDPGEGRIPGVTVTLRGPVVETVTTDSAGRFVFAGLASGTYSLTETQPGDYADGRSVVGSAGGASASSNTITGIVVGADTDNTGYGFSELTPAVTLAVTTQTVAAPVAPGPSILTGSPVVWTYTVGNPGDTTLDGIRVVDDEQGAVVCEATTLAPGESTTCTATGTASAGQYESTATVVADVATPEPIARAVTTVSSEAQAHYFGVQAGLTTSITVNGVDVTSSPGPKFLSGSPTTLAVTVTNTGNAPTTVRVPTAPGAGALICDASTTLAPGASVTCSVTWTPPLGTYALTVGVTGSAPASVGVDGSTTPVSVTTSGVAYFVVAAVVPPGSGGGSGGGAGSGSGGSGSGGDSGSGGTPPALAFTGTSVVGLLLAGLALVGVGLVLRRRRRAAAPSADSRR